MKYLIILLLPIAANAACFSDFYGNVTCMAYSLPEPALDFRNSTNSPVIIENGKYRGNLNNNQLDPNSVNNPMGKYGNPMSQDSILNPFRSR